MAEFFNVSGEAGKINALVAGVASNSDLDSVNASNAIGNLVSEVSSLAHSPTKLQTTADELNKTSSFLGDAVAGVSFLRDACGNVQSVDFLARSARPEDDNKRNFLVDLSADVKCDRPPLPVEQLKVK